MYTIKNYPKKPSKANIDREFQRACDTWSKHANVSFKVNLSNANDSDVFVYFNKTLGGQPFHEGALATAKMSVSNIYIAINILFLFYINYFRSLHLSISTTMSHSMSMAIQV